MTNRRGLVCFFAAFVFVGFFAAICVVNAEGNDYETRKGIKTLNRILFPIIKANEKRELDICWHAKLCWVGGHWERQIVLYNGTKKPPVDHPAYDYVRNLPPADFPGEKYESLYSEFFKCNTSPYVFDYRSNFQGFIDRKGFRQAEGTHPDTGNRENDRKMARTAALRNIVEQFGVKVESETDVSNYELARDLVKTRASKTVQFVPAVEQYHARDGRKEYQIIIFGWLDQ